MTAHKRIYSDFLFVCDHAQKNGVTPISSHDYWIWTQRCYLWGIALHLGGFQVEMTEVCIKNLMDSSGLLEMLDSIYVFPQCSGSHTECIDYCISCAHMQTSLLMQPSMLLEQYREVCPIFVYYANLEHQKALIQIFLKLLANLLVGKSMMHALMKPS